MKPHRISTETRPNYGEMLSPFDASFTFNRPYNYEQDGAKSIDIEWISNDGSMSSSYGFSLKQEHDGLTTAEFSEPRYTYFMIPHLNEYCSMNIDFNGITYKYSILNHGTGGVEIFEA